jgi:hypothetical protein
MGLAHAVGFGLASTLPALAWLARCVRAFPMLRLGQSGRRSAHPSYHFRPAHYHHTLTHVILRRKGRAPAMEKMAMEGAVPAMEKMAGRGPSWRPPAPRSRRRRGQRRRGRSKPMYLGFGGGAHRRRSRVRVWGWSSDLTGVGKDGGFRGRSGVVEDRRRWRLEDGAARWHLHHRPWVATVGGLAGGGSGGAGAGKEWPPPREERRNRGGGRYCQGKEEK